MNEKEKFSPASTAKFFLLEAFRYLFFLFFLAGLGGLLYLVRFLKQDGELEISRNLETRPERENSFLQQPLPRELLGYFQVILKEDGPGLPHEE